jgi:hypothetical protein
MTAHTDEGGLAGRGVIGGQIPEMGDEEASQAADVQYCLALPTDPMTP